MTASWRTRPARCSTRSCATALLRAAVAAEPVEAAVCAKYGVRLAEQRALRVLHDLGEAPIGPFAEAVEIPRSAATIAVDRLERTGWWSAWRIPPTVA
jgi:DNA-binding MarR family transcriptional regulator